MPNYQDGKIYSIRSPNIEKYYIGSTIEKLCRRLSQHKTNSKSSSNKFYSSKIIIEAGDAYIELIENFPCDNKEELCKREGELQRQYKNEIINNVVIGRTQKEYREDHKEHYKNLHKQHYELNKDKYNNKEYKKQWYQANKERIKLNKQLS